MLPVPKLDNSSFSEIYAIMRRMAEVRLGQPPDASYQDPGSTLLEMFALLFDMQRFYMDFITGEHRNSYARLLGGKPSPLTPATVQVEILRCGSRVLPAGTPINAGGVPFELIRRFEFCDNTLENAYVRVETAGEGEAKDDRLRITLEFSKDLSVYPVGRVYVGRNSPLPFPMDHWCGSYKDCGGNPRDIEHLGEHVTDGYLALEIAGEMWNESGAYKAELTMTSDFAFIPPVGFVRINAAGARQVRTWCSYTDAKPKKNGEIRLDAYLAIYGKVEVFGLESGAYTRLAQGGDYTLSRDETDGYAVCTVFTGHKEYRILWYDADFEETRRRAVSSVPKLSVPLPVEHLNGDTLELMTSVGGVWQAWTRVESFNGSGCGDRHFRVRDGEICFGDHERGDTPKPGDLLIIRCESSLGQAGNIREINNEMAVSITPASGGRDRLEIEMPPGTRKAVTAGDYISLLMNCGDLKLEQVGAVAKAGSENNGVEMCLYVKPVSDKPFPGLSDAYKKNILAYVEPFRVITTKLAVYAADYVPFSLELSAVFDSRYDEKQRREMVIEALKRKFPYRGFSGGVRRAFGERITFGEIYACIRETSCVKIIKALKLLGFDGGELDYLPLGPGQLAYLDGVTFGETEIRHA